MLVQWPMQTHTLKLTQGSNLTQDIAGRYCTRVGSDLAQADEEIEDVRIVVQHCASINVPVREAHQGRAHPQLLSILTTFYGLGGGGS